MRSEAASAELVARAHEMGALAGRTEGASDGGGREEDAIGGLRSHREQKSFTPAAGSVRSAVGPAVVTSPDANFVSAKTIN